MVVLSMHDVRPASLIDAPDASGGGQQDLESTAVADQSSDLLLSGATPPATLSSTRNARVAPALSQRTTNTSLRRQTTGSLSATRRPSTASPQHRRRSSVFQELKRAAQGLLHGADDEDESSDTATIAQEDGGAKYIHQTFEALVKQLCKDKLTDATEVEGPIGAWRVKHMQGVDDPRVLSFFNDALPSVVARLVKFEDARIMMRNRKIFRTVALIFFDTLSDYSACWVLLKDGSSYGIAMLVVLTTSMLLQAATARYVTREGPIATIGALLGLKPILDGVNLVFDIPPQPGAITSTLALGYTRGLEMSTESIPFAVIQALALMKQRSLAQAVSFVITLVNISYTVVSVDHQIDMNPKIRTAEPMLQGYYPHGSKASGLFCSIAVSALGYLMAKLVAIATLGTASPGTLAFVLIGECATFWLVRFMVGNWRYFNPAGETSFINLLCHTFGLYPCMIAAPIPFFRHPTWLSPLVYSGFVLWTLFAANPLMLALALHYDTTLPINNPRLLWIVLGGATAVCVLCTLLASQLMVPSFRSTFFCHRTLATHLREFHWMRETKWDGASIECNDDLDAVRARILKMHATNYWPADLARQWTRDGWARWLSNPPIWFTKKWKKRIPEEWFGGDDDSAVVAMTSQEVNFRNAIGTTIPWCLNALELESYFEKHFVNSATLPSTESDKTKRRQLAHLLVGAGGGVGLLDKCCATDAKAPWVQISHTTTGKPLQADETRRQQLTTFLCKAGLAFYYQLFVTSVSHSPLHGYRFVSTLARHAHYQLMLVRNVETEHVAILTLTTFCNLETTQMARQKKTLTDVQKSCVTLEFIMSLYHWGSNGSVVFILGEYCGGGALVEHIKPESGIEDDKEFWRLAFQLARGIADIHHAGLTHMDVWAQNALLTEDGDVRYGHIGLQRAGDGASMTSYHASCAHQIGIVGPRDTPGPQSDIRSVATLLYRMCTGEQQAPELSLSPDELLAKIRDPLKCDLVSRSLLGATKPSASELVQLISELSPFDVRQFSRATRDLVELEKRVKAATEDEVRRSVKLLEATSVVMICEPGNGVGCESALLLLRALQELGHLKPLGVIANHWPSSERSRLLRGTLDLVGLHDIPVGVGSDGGSTPGSPGRADNPSWNSGVQSYTSALEVERNGTIITGPRLLQMVFADAEPASITLLCTSSLKDAAIFLRDSGTTSP